MARPTHVAARFYLKAADCLNMLQPVFLLAIRLYIGWLFFKSGRGKLTNIDTTAEFFAGLNIPLPVFNAYLSGAVEALGGLLLMFGLAARLAAIPLIGNMLIAYATAHPEELKAIFSDPNRFLKAPPFLYLLTSVIILLFGPGALSLDGLLRRRFSGDRPQPGPHVS